MFGNLSDTLYSFVLFVNYHHAATMKRLSVLALGLFLVVGLCLPLQAQAQMDGETTVRIGPRIGVPFGDLGDGSSVFFGAEARVDTEALPVVPNASFDYYLTDADNLTYFAVDLNALYEFEVEEPTFVPYAGGGLGITRVSFDVDNSFGGFDASSTEIGINLVGGARFPLGSVEPFAQLNATLGGDAQRLALAGGLLFSL